MSVRQLRSAMFVAVSLALGFGLATSGLAETWRMPTKMPPDSPEGKAFQLFADKVAEYSGGALEVKIFPSEQLGKTEAVLEQLHAGTVQVYPEGPTYIEKWVPPARFMSPPFVFDSREHWARFMQTDLVKGWIEQLEATAGITLIGNVAAFVRGPYRVLVAKKPVKSLADVQGLKLRLPPAELHNQVWTYLGAEVRVLGWTEVYESIDRGIVEAVTSPIALVESMRFYEVAPHIVRTDEYPQGIAFMVNAPAYRGLSPELREAVDKAHADASAYSAEVMGKIAVESIARMKEKGVTYDEIDTSPFVEKMKTFYQEMEQKGELPEGFLAAVEASR